VDMCKLFPATASNFYMRLHTRLAESLSTVTFRSDAGLFGTTCCQTETTLRSGLAAGQPRANTNARESARETSLAGRMEYAWWERQ
jgi:hypothetical protein